MLICIGAGMRDSLINYAHFNSNDGQDKDYTKNLIKKYLLSSLNGQ